MKKLTIALAAIMAGLAVNAATIKWNSGTIYNQAGTKANKTTAVVTAYLYSLTEAQYATVSAMTADAIYTAAQAGSYGTAAVTQTSTALGAINITQTVTGGTSESPVTYYGLVVYEDAVSDGGPYVKAAAKTVTFQDDGSTTLASLASSQSTWTATSAVPEPTSGLLMLLGVAGLALRRRRA